MWGYDNTWVLFLPHLRTLRLPDTLKISEAFSPHSVTLLNVRVRRLAVKIYFDIRFVMTLENENETVSSNMEGL